MLEEIDAATAYRVLRSGPRPSSRGTGIKLRDGREVLHAVTGNSNLALLIPIGETEMTFLHDNVQGIKLTVSDVQAAQDGTFSSFLVVENVESNLERPFSYFVDEVVETLQFDSNDAIKRVILCLERWRRLLAPTSSGLLSIEAQAGLLHELMVLQLLIERQNPDVLQFWNGPRGGKHDFGLPDYSIEVKSSLTHDSFRVRVSSLEQLVEAKGSDLFLVAGKFEAVSSGSLSLPSVIDSILAKAVDSQELFSKLANVGYYEQHRALYADSKFNILASSVFHVDENFPRITPDILSAINEKGRISGVQYFIDLSAAESFESYVAEGLASVIRGDGNV